MAELVDLPARLATRAERAGRQAHWINLYMYNVYAIKSTIKNYIYVGLTNNLEKRFYQHNSGKEKTTRPYIPFVVIYTKNFETRKEARTHEKYLKSCCGKEFLKSF